VLAAPKEGTPLRLVSPALLQRWDRRFWLDTAVISRRGLHWRHRVRLPTAWELLRRRRLRPPQPSARPRASQPQLSTN